MLKSNNSFEYQKVLGPEELWQAMLKGDKSDFIYLNDTSISYNGKSYLIDYG